MRIPQILGIESLQKWHFLGRHARGSERDICTINATCNSNLVGIDEFSGIMLVRPILAVTALLATSTHALFFYLDGTNPKCFYEELPKDTLVVGREFMSKDSGSFL